MKRMYAVIAVAIALTGLASAKDKPAYQVGVLQKHTQDTQRIGTDFNGISCDSGRCVGSAAGIYATSNFWDIRVEGGYWELQPNWQENSKHDPLNTAKEGDKILFRIAKKHFLNGSFDAAYLPRTDDPDKEIFLLAKWVSDNPVVTSTPQPKSQLEVACATGKLTPDQQKQFCDQPVAAPPVVSAAPTPAPTQTVGAVKFAAMFAMADKASVENIGIYPCDKLVELGAVLALHKDVYPLAVAAYAAKCNAPVVVAPAR
jgi:hypothetical protein